MTRTRRSAGQAAIELLGLVPAVLVVALGAWQLAAVSWAALQADEEVRARAMGAGGAPGTVTVAATVGVPSLLPGVRGLAVTARAAVRKP